MGNLINQMAFPKPDVVYSMSLLQGRNDIRKFQTSKGKLIFAVDMVSTKRPFTILYSHGNAEDVGLTLPYLEALRRVTECSIFAYEYEGYSLTQGQPTEQGCYDSINAAYEYLVNVKHIPKERIFIFGRSIGSGPSTDLASRCGADGCAGLILQSPIESGGRAIFGGVIATIGSCIDIFKNIEKVDMIEVPVCIMHGEEDTVVPINNGRNLYERLRARNLAAKPLWIRGRGHNDMPEINCLAHCREFITGVIQAKYDKY